MKGLLLNSAVQCKTYCIVALCEFIVFLTLTIAIFSNCSHIPEVMTVAMLIPVLAPIAIVTTLLEGTNKRLEKMLKCGFLKYTLTSGVSRVKYVLTEIIENLIVVVISMALSLIIYWSAYIITPDFFSMADDIKIILGMCLGFGLFAYLANVAALFFKNTEVSSLVLGMVIGLIATIFIALSEDKVISIDFTNTATQLITVGICLALYVISTVIMKLRLERYSG